MNQNMVRLIYNNSIGKYITQLLIMNLILELKKGNEFFLGNNLGFVGLTNAFWLEGGWCKHSLAPPYPYLTKWGPNFIHIFYFFALNSISIENE